MYSVHREFDYLFPPVFHGLLSGWTFIEHIIFSYSKILHPICNRELCICDYQSLIIAIQSNSPSQINNYLYKNKSYLPFLLGTWSHLGFNIWVQCCGVRYDFHINTMFGSSLPPVVGGLMSYLRYLCLLVQSGVQCILCCVFALFVSVLCLVYPMFPVLLDCWLSPWYSLTFI